MLYFRENEACEFLLDDSNKRHFLKRQSSHTKQMAGKFQAGQDLRLLLTTTSQSLKQLLVNLTA